jgi:ATP-dependent RNA circularization protein (DNA/RNA ligase family)
MKPPAERIVDELRRTALEPALERRLEHRTYTLAELLDGAADRIVQLEERLVAYTKGFY